MKFYGNAINQMRRDLIGAGYEYELEIMSLYEMEQLWKQEIDYNELDNEDF